jgi:hypothetical protein
MWQIWPGQLWPLTVDQEAEFLAELESRVTRVSRPTRDDVTALMSMLRCGTPLSDALTFAPGLRLPALLGAYRRMETLRSTSADAWARISADPTPQVWKTDRRAAAKLLPVAIDRLTAAFADHPGGTTFERAVRQVQRRIDDTVIAAAELESRAAEMPAHMPQTAVVTSALYNPLGTCVYADPFYLPDRVSTISPARVGDLLGEERR